MAEAADTLDGDEISAAGLGISKSVVHGDAGTEQRRGFVGGNVVGDKGNRLGGDDDVLGVSTIEMDTGDLFVLAMNEVAAAAGLAGEAMAAVPADANALPGASTE